MSAPAPRSFARLVLFALLVGALLVAGLACEPAPAPPPLISATDFAPREAEIGDRLEVTGAGFPKGKTARVVFRGALHRPGEAPGAAEIEAQGTAESPQTIELPLTESLEALFCGRGDRAAHTTFRGEVEVAFPAVAPGAPPVAAAVRNVVLDLRPAAPRRAIADARRADAERALGLLGLAMEPARRPAGGLVVRAVVPGSRADQAGISAGNVITSFDGVRVVSLEDMVPSGARARVAIGVLADDVESVKEAPIDGLPFGPPRELLPGALLVAALAAFVLLFVAPGAGLLAWLERRVAARAAATRGALLAMRHLGPRFAGAARASAAAEAPVLAARAPYVAAACASLLFAVMPFGRYVVLAELDIALLFLVSLTSLALIGWLTGGWRAAARIVSFEVPAALAVACVVLLTGSTRLHDIVRAQGAAPWEWNAFRSPAALVLFALHLTGALAQTRLAPPELAEADGPARPGAGGAPRWVPLVAEWANIAVTSGTSAALFLGGWQIPGISLLQQHGSVALELAGSALFLLKAAALVALVVGARAALPVVRVDQATRVCWRWLIPLAAASLALSVGWFAWTPSARVEHAVALATWAAAALGAARFVHRVRWAARAPRGDLRVSPFL